MEPIIPIERIQAEAEAAARRYSDVNDACPYPFDSDAGHHFKARFLAARQAMAAAEAKGGAA